MISHWHQYALSKITVGDSKSAAIPRIDFLTFPVSLYTIRKTAIAAK